MSFKPFGVKGLWGTRTQEKFTIPTMCHGNENAFSLSLLNSVPLYTKLCALIYKIMHPYIQKSVPLYTK
jgi:hypothetical protein